MATVTTHSMVKPYCVTTRGPSTHSPRPMDMDRTMAPGPMILTALRKLKSGGTGRSATFHAGPVPDDAGS